MADTRKTKSDPENESGITRRTFVQVGAAGLAIASTGALRPLKACTTANTAAKAPRIGAIYNCSYRWDGTGWTGIRSVSALGRYDSGDIGAIDTHLVWAKNWGISFFLALTETDSPKDYRTRNMKKLFDRAEKTDFDVALLLSYPEKGRMSGTDWLSGRLRGVKTSGILKRKNYLRAADGRPIIAIRSRNPEAALQAVSEVASNDVWLWVVSDEPTPQSFRSDSVAWVSPRSAATARFQALRGGSKVALLPLPAKGGAKAVTPEQLSAYGGSAYIVIDSFNDWANQPTLEPTPRDRSQAAYVYELRKQMNAVAR